MITTQRELRAAFWREHVKVRPGYIRTKTGAVCATAIAWSDYVGYLCDCGTIPEALAGRATL